MSCSSVLRQIEERHIANQIDLLVWSNRLDLLALSNFKGEVQIHRLSWQKVWSFSPPAENLKVQAIAWRPDGKALAVGYNTGCVCIISIEDKEILDKFNLDEETSKELENQEKCGVTFLTWLTRSGTLQNIAEYNIYEDANIFLSKPILNNVGYKNKNMDIREFMEAQEQSQLNMLFAGFGNGNIHLNVFGRFPFCTIHLRELLNDDYGEYKIIDINLSDDFSILQVFYLDKATKNIFVSIINVSVLCAFSEEVFTVANRHVQIAQLLSNVDFTMISITEAWENIILEMDAKMANYAASVPEGAVSADFLELLMMGVPSDELELFLIQDLTTKGLKKFGSSVELSYSTIQKLVLKQLNIIGQSLTYHLSELRGLARIPDRYKILGLNENIITDAIRSSCAFLNKCLELQQVIDISMRNYKAFFRWLYGVIVRLLDEQAPTEIVKITQQDLTHIADFLFNFDNVKVNKSDNESDKTVRFNLEKLSQYLQDQNLSILPDEAENPWQKFLKENPCLLKESDTFFLLTEFRKFSLVQQQNHLKKSINKVFDISGKDFGSQFTLLHNLKCYEDISLTRSPNIDFKLSQIHDTNNGRFMTVLYHSSCESFCFKSIDINSKDNTYKSLKCYFTNLSEENDDTLEILDVMFYSTDYISILLKHSQKEDSNIFIQMPVRLALEQSAEYSTKVKLCIFNDNTPKINFTPLLEQGGYRILDKMDGLRIAVSGGRKVAIVLSRSKRKVRLYEMVDAEDEDDETKSHITTQLSDSHDISEEIFATSDDKSMNELSCSRT